MSTQKIRELIREYVKAGVGGTYEPTNASGIIQNEERISDYVTFIENIDTNDGSTTLEVKVSKKINKPEIEKELNTILPVKYKIFDYNNGNDVKHKKNEVINDLWGRISKYLWL